VLLINAEDDRLCEPILLTHELSEVLRNGVRAGSQRHDSLEVFGLVFVVGNDAAVSVEFVFAWPPAGSVPLGDYPMDPIRREEAVIDSLPQAVFVNRIAEVAIGVARLGAEWGGGHAELGSWLEVL
jgi:hypothetical protein